jgi:hypothetical protein
MAQEIAKTRKQWADEINAACTQAITAYLEIGRKLVAAKEAMPHGEFLAMIEVDLPFSTSKADRLMRIASDERISAHGPNLPQAWRTVYELSKLDDDTFQKGIASGAINPRMTRADAARIVGVNVTHQPSKAPSIRPVYAAPPPPEPETEEEPLTHENWRPAPPRDRSPLPIAKAPLPAINRLGIAPAPPPIAPPGPEVWQRSVALHAGEAIGLAKNWEMRFGDAWKTFPVDDALVSRIREAADAWDMILRAVSDQLEKQKAPAE